MMNKQNRYIATGAALGMLMLIFDGKTALTGAADGIQLCINTLIPSLFPFFVLSTLLIDALTGQALPFLRPVVAAFKIPKGAESLLAIGLLGGYPVGAQNIALLHNRGELTGAQAARLIVFCNNAGPAFIFGVLGAIFPGRTTAWLLWLVHILSALLVGLLLPGTLPERSVSQNPQKVRVTDALSRGIKVMSFVCGWVVLARMLLTLMENWLLWMLPLPMQVILTGILELSNGCVRLAELNCEGLQFLIAAAFLSLGGVCITLQTATVTQNISMKLYFPGKILQCCISIILSGLMQPLFPVSSRCNCSGAILVSAAVMVVILLRMKHFKKSSGIPATIGV